MSVPRERFREGITWDDWLERLGPEGTAWRERFEATSLGTLRAEYQSVPWPRYVLCLFDPDDPASRDVVPVLARACEQTGVAGGVEFRLFPLDEAPDLAAQFRGGKEAAFPACVVFDRDWIQVGLWRLHRDSERGADRTQRILAEFLEALREQPNRPWHGHATHTEHRWKQAEQSPGTA